MKTAVLFAGQGAQYVGMGRELAEHSAAARALALQANATLGIDLAKLCFEGPEELLTQTEFAQPAIYLVSWMAWAALKECYPDFEFHAAAGLSLGELTALSVAGAMSFEAGLNLVRARGRFMQEACGTTQGGMAAILGLDESSVRRLCEESGVSLANLNCPGQIVISGAADRIPRAVELALARGARKAMRLTVAGAYHSPLMASAQPKLAAELERHCIRAPGVPVIANVTAGPYTSSEEISRCLVQQVVEPVRWEDSIRYLLLQGITRSIELGPGAVLSGFHKRIDKSAQIMNIEDSASLSNTKAILGQTSIQS